MAIRARENLIGAWAFMIGTVSAVLFGLIVTYTTGASITPASTIARTVILTILAVLGGVVGYVVAEKDIKTFLMASTALALVSFVGIQGTIQTAAILGIGLNKAITNILSSLLVLYIPSTIVVAIKTVFSIAKS